MITEFIKKQREKRWSKRKMKRAAIPSQWVQAKTRSIELAKFALKKGCSVSLAATYAEISQHLIYKIMAEHFPCRYKELIFTETGDLIQNLAEKNSSAVDWQIQTIRKKLKVKTNVAKAIKGYLVAKKLFGT